MTNFDDTNFEDQLYLLELSTYLEPKSQYSFDDTYFEDQLYLLELSTYLEPKSQYSFDYTFQSIDKEIPNFALWDTCIDGPAPSPYQEGDHAPWNWYTQYWFNCTTTIKVPSSTKTSSETSSTTPSKTTKPSIPETSSTCTKLCLPPPTTICST